MASDTFDRIFTSIPQGKTAALVTSKGEHYDPEIAPTHPHFSSPPKMKRVPNDPCCQNLTGMKMGRLTVLGLADTHRGNGGRGGSWVVRCVCGYYEFRNKKAILNPENKDDACAKCRAWQRAKWQYDNFGSRPINEFFVSVK